MCEELLTKIEKELEGIYIELNVVRTFIPDYIYANKTDTITHFRSLFRELSFKENIDAICNILPEEYSLLLDSMFKEMLYTCFIIIHYVCNITYKTYTDIIRNKELLERIYIRIACLKQGWTPKAIESMLSRYYKNVMWNDWCDIYYIKFKRILSYFNVEKIQKNGRPKLPEFVHSILIKYRKMKNKDNMSDTYRFKRNIRDIFTKDDIAKLKHLSSADNELINKLNLFESHL